MVDGPIKGDPKTGVSDPPNFAADLANVPELDSDITSRRQVLARFGHQAARRNISDLHGPDSFIRRDFRQQQETVSFPVLIDFFIHRSASQILPLIAAIRTASDTEQHLFGRHGTASRNI